MIFRFSTLTVLLVSAFLLAVLASEALGAPVVVPTRMDVSYGPHPHQLLDVYIPPAGTGPFPVLIWFGGLWAPSKGVPDLNKFFGAHCAVVGVEMRVMDDGIKETLNPPVSACLLDARRAVQYVRLHAAEWKLDADRIAVAGGSQGTLPALYVGCAGERADPRAIDPVERVSTKVTCVGAWRSQPSIDPKRMQEWVPGVEWGAPAFGCSFAESLQRREELLPLISQWSPDALLHRGAPPIYFENNWGLDKPDAVQEMDYRVHSPRWALGFQKLAQEHDVICYVKFPDHPSAKYADMWDFLLEELGADVRPSAAERQPHVRNDIEYARVGEQSLKLDLYLPVVKKPPLLTPLIVWVHGGLWRGGSRSDMPIGRLVDAGYAVASVDYRLSPVAPFPAQIFDIKAAIRYLRARAGDYGYDPKRFAIAGSSAGGHLAALVGVTNGNTELEGTVGANRDQSSDVSAIISLYGASDLESILGQSTPSGRKVRIPALQLLLGGQPEEKPDLAKLASPVIHVDAHDPPLLLIHGDSDPQMPPEQSRELAAVYKKAGLPVILEIIPGAVHGGPPFYDETRIALMKKFLSDVLAVRE